LVVEENDEKAKPEKKDRPHTKVKIIYICVRFI
jgi:hypothetical protein